MKQDGAKLGQSRSINSRSGICLMQYLRLPGLTSTMGLNIPA